MTQEVSTDKDNVSPRPVNGPPQADCYVMPPAYDVDPQSTVSQI